MTDPITGQSVSLRKLFWSSLPLAGLIGAVLSALLTVVTAGMIALFAEPVRNRLGLASADQVAELTEALRMFKVATDASFSEAKAQIADMQRAIAIASRPEAIVIYRDLPRPAHGACAPGGNCTLVVFAERDPLAVDCRIIPGTTELRIAAGGREYAATVLGTRPGSNLTNRPQAVEPTFVLPVSIPPGAATAVIRTYYTSCPWQNDGQPPAIQDSPMFPLEIRP